MIPTFRLALYLSSLPKTPLGMSLFRHREQASQKADPKSSISFESIHPQKDHKTNASELTAGRAEVDTFLVA